MQGLRESPIVVIDRLHVPGDTGIFSRAANNADRRSTLVKFMAGYLDISVFENQCPLALEAVSHARAYTDAAVGANRVFVFVEQRLIENQDITCRVTGFAGIDKLRLADTGICDGDEFLG